MYAYDIAKKEAVSLLKSAGVKDVKTEKPPKNIDADISFPCFALSKELKKSPGDIASELKAKIDKKITEKGIIKRCEILGPYLNFYLDPEKLAKSVAEDIETMKDRYGSCDEGRNKKLIVEYVSANPIHPLHIGSARNA
ncbi:MAG: arginine--tRNA ligase, partial [Candidatus Aenigmarchaeota archaeon]|nr:arginine--tRNA ligase [Candidatus Aenigmarchaeota archaeon]